MAAWIVGVWLFAFGSAVGSFLNVVVYRLPAGINLAWPGSHCPACKKPIRWYDNVPIFGWLALRGRCRDCSVWISARYPIVETVTAVMFLLVGAVEVLMAEAGTAGAGAAGAGEQAADVLTTWTRQLGTCGYHLLLLCTLLAAALIHHDGHAAPKRLFLAAITGGALAPLIWLHLHPTLALPEWEGRLATSASLALGAAAGLLIGGGIAVVTASKDRAGVVLAAVSVGLILGGLAAVAVSLTALVAWLLGKLLRRLNPRAAQFSVLQWMLPSTLAWILSRPYWWG